MPGGSGRRDLRFAIFDLRSLRGFAALRLCEKYVPEMVDRWFHAKPRSRKETQRKSKIENRKSKIQKCLISLISPQTFQIRNRPAGSLRRSKNSARAMRRSFA